MMAGLTSKRWLGLLLALIFLAAASASAQTSKGSIVGTITDPQGAVVAGATVTAENSQVGGERRVTTTDSSGAFRFEALSLGIYKVTVKAAGFTELVITGVAVRAATSATVNGTLEVSAVSSTVTVEATTGQELQTESGELSNTITKKEIGELPILNLNPISLVLTEPGVTAPSSREDFTNGVGFSVNGTRPRGNNFLLDGQSNNDLSITGQAFQPTNLEAVGEVTILTNSYSAEFGKGGGSVTNVIYKGGTNNFHGSAWDLIQNSALQAIDASLKAPNGDTTKNPVTVDNTFGFSFGGPAIKDKLFGFGSAQWDRFRSTATDLNLRVPTDAGVAVLQSLGPNARIDSLLQAIGRLRGQNTINTIALGNGRPGVETGLVAPSGLSQFSNSREWVVKGDWLPTQSDAVSVRYLDSRQTFAPDTFANPGQLPGFRTQQGGPSKNLSTNWTHTFSSNAVNEARFAYSSIDFSFGLLPETAANPAASGPTAFIANLLSTIAGIGVNPAFPQGRANQTWQFQDAASYTVGRHTLKFGFDVANYIAQQNVPFNSRGTINFVNGGDCGGTPCTALANYIDDFTGPTGTLGKVFGSPLVRPNQVIQGYYGEDTWRITQNFTVDFGLRYEYFGTPENVLDFPTIRPELGQFTDPFPTRIEQVKDTNNWGPRVGIAYTPRFWTRFFGQDKTVIRAGYGLYYDGLFNNILVNTAASAPNVVGGNITAPNSGRGLGGAFGQVGAISPSALNPLSSVTSVASDVVSPLTHQWNLNVQRELPGNFIVSGAYVGTRGVRLFGNDEFNYRINGVRINPARGLVLARTNGRDSIYHSAQLKVDRRFTRGFLLRGSYTFSRLIDNGSEVFTTSGGTTRFQDFTNPGADRGLSAFHRAHRFVITYVWELPYVKADQGGWRVLNAITRDWQVSGTTTFQSGAPETISIQGIETNRDGSAFNGRPNFGNLGAPFNSIGIDGTLFGVPTPAGTLFEVQNFLQCDDISIICQPPQPIDTFHWLIQAGNGNVGRNTIITPGRQDWNFGILRRIRLPKLEGHALEFRTEFFNIFNHPNQGYSGLTNFPTFDTLDSNFSNTELSRFGGRQIRFWLKYTF